MIENGMLIVEDDLYGVVRVGEADTYLIIYTRGGGDCLSLTPEKMRELKKIWKRYKKAMIDANRTPSQNVGTPKAK